jgi:hypothetical protein
MKKLYRGSCIFLPNLAPFCQAVSEEKIFLNSSQSESRIALGGNICWWNGTERNRETL